MKIVIDFPPNIEAIRTAFQLNGKEIFTYGDTVYNPTGERLPPELEAHEAVHMKQQVDPVAWWDRYLVDPQFRFEQELEAHKAEYRYYCSKNKDRNKQARFLQAIALRLASPTYGSIITSSQAAKAIRS